ncbi:hypothetical protein [Aeromonas veronii]|nr:hypothetical protein [Aeromonas veronii]
MSVLALVLPQAPKQELSWVLLRVLLEQLLELQLAQLRVQF